jgi:transposase
VATRRYFTQEYRDQAVSLVLDSGRSIAEVAKSIGVHEMTLGKWAKNTIDSGPVLDKNLSETERVELEQLRKENAILRMERDFAKKWRPGSRRNSRENTRRSRTGRLTRNSRSPSCATSLGWSAKATRPGTPEDLR